MKNIIRKSLALCCVLVIVCVNCIGCNGNNGNDNPIIITEINQPFENSNIKATITELNKEPDSTQPDSIIITARFVIENVSNSDITTGRFYIKSYVDDVLVDNTASPGTISPGKRLESDQSVYTADSSKILEFYFNDPKTGKHVATFAFNINDL